MITTDYATAIDELRRRGIDNINNAKTLWKTIKESVIYKFRRNKNMTWQYEVVMKGYGKPPKMKTWVSVTVLPPLKDEDLN